MIEWRSKGTSVVLKPQRNIKIVACGDLHVPFHDPTAILLCLKIIKMVKPHVFILAGDVVDFYAVSKYLRNPQRRLMLGDEIKQATEVIKRFYDAAPNALHIFLAGNHEQRLKNYLYSVAPELSSLPQLSLQELLGLKKWIVLEHQDFPQSIEGDRYPLVTFEGNHLTIRHGDGLRLTSSAINIARCVFLRTLSNTIVFHFHHLSVFVQKDYFGKVKGCWSIPCLALPRPAYEAGKIYDQGFVVIEYFTDGSFRVIPVLFFHEDGHLFCHFEGKKITQKKEG